MSKKKGKGKKKSAALGDEVDPVELLIGEFKKMKKTA